MLYFSAQCNKLLFEKPLATMIKIPKPPPGEYHPDALPYINLVPADANIVKQLSDNFKKTKVFVLAIPRNRLSVSYAPGKWSIKQILVHLIDEERVYTCRALRIARNDKTPLPGYNAEEYVCYARANEKSLKDIFEEFENARQATISLFKNLDEAAFLRRGIVNDNTISVRAMAYHIAGHELHHMQVIKERYL